jgi:hypothetical protein
MQRTTALLLPIPHSRETRARLVTNRGRRYTNEISTSPQALLQPSLTTTLYSLALLARQELQLVSLNHPQDCEDRRTAAGFLRID